MSFSESDDVVDLQLKKTTAFLELQVDIRRGVERRPCCSSLNAQQVRAARLLHRLRLTRARFGCTLTPLPHAPPPPYLKQAMDHGCLPCAVQSFAEALLSLVQLGPAAYDGQIWTCENIGMLAAIDGKYTARLG